MIAQMGRFEPGINNYNKFYLQGFPIFNTKNRIIPDLYFR